MSNPANWMQKYPMIDDLIPVAHRRLPQFSQDYLEHGAGRETLLRRNREAYDNVHITPRYMRDMSVIDTSKTLFGKTYQLPFGIAPIGMGGMIWPNAESALAKTAASREIPMVLSTVACASIEATAERCNGHLWYQLYSPADETIRWNLLERASNAGVEVLVVTVDAPGPARRERPSRSGFSMAPKVTARMIMQALLHPRWTAGILKSGMPRFSNFRRSQPANVTLQASANDVRQQLGRQVLPTELEAIRQRWPGKLVVKGILDPQDALTAVAAGADGIVVSNHGGRHTDTSPTSLEVLPAIRQAVGADISLILDSGVRSGLDIYRALATGADFVLLGRPFYYGLAALGPLGAGHVVNILADELQQSMRQLGADTLSSIQLSSPASSSPDT